MNSLANKSDNLNKSQEISSDQPTDLSGKNRDTSNPRSDYSSNMPNLFARNEAIPSTISQMNIFNDDNISDN